MRRTVGLVLAGWLLVYGGGCSRGEQEPTPAAKPAVAPTRLIGQWVRTDGSYMLDVTAVHADRTAQVGYFNPRPIHVAEASVAQVEDQLQLAVRLDDQGYPNCTYQLTYDEMRDTLEGDYYQAAMGQTYRVSFMRRPATP